MGATTNAFAIAADFSAAGRNIQDRANRVTRHHAMLLQARIKANASGRPGPRAPTGDYRGDWSTTHAGNTSTVANSKPQAHRLEYGFYGPDRLGRVYAQPPYPHVGPAVDATEGPYRLALSDIATDI